MSLSIAVDVAERIKKAGKPARILYFCDCDGQGYTMPAVFARKLEFYLRRETGMDAQVKHVALTNEQVAQYHSPRGLNTTNNKTQQQFSDEYSGFVELDAFVGKHMHVFRQLVTDELDRFYDHDLDTHVWKYESGL